MEIRRATIEDIDMLIHNRIEFVKTFKPLKNEEEFTKTTYDYMSKHLISGNLLAIVAIEDNQLVSNAILTIYETLPRPSAQKGKCGLLLNVNTKEEYRRKNIATQVLNMLIEEATKLGVGRITLDYTSYSYELYKKLGFVELNKEMCLNIN